MVVVLGRELLADKYLPMINEHAETPSENAAMDVIVAKKMVGALKAVRVPYFPANSLMITRLDNPPSTGRKAAVGQGSTPPQARPDRKLRIQQRRLCGRGLRRDRGRGKHHVWCPPGVRELMNILREQRQRKLAALQGAARQPCTRGTGR